MFDYPVESTVLRHQAVKHGFCPECGGDLDTGWECTACGFDAKPIADAIKEDLHA